MGVPAGHFGISPKCYTDCYLGEGLISGVTRPSCLPKRCVLGLQSPDLTHFSLSNWEQILLLAVQFLSRGPCRTVINQ